jgi:hypothetical protein
VQNKDEHSSRADETALRQELTDAMQVAAAMAFHDWQNRKRTNKMLSVRDLVFEMWIAFRRAGDSNL